MKNLTTEQKQNLLKSLKIMIDLYNKNTPGINYIDVRNLQLTLEDLGVDTSEI